MQKHLLEKLTDYNQTDFYPLHMPGHKRRLSHFADPFSIDITEIDGFDNLHHAEDLLMEAQQRAAALYRADKSWYLINGSTCGILAAVSACCRRGERILMARNCHKAAYHAVLLNDLHVTWIYPKLDLMRGIIGGISPLDVECAMEREPEIKVVFLTSPTYDGVVSDIQQIAEIVHRRNGILIVDEAHGAHFVMHSDFPKSALALGSDIVINSLHKTMPSLTQTALLHVKGTRVDCRRLQKYLGIYQSSSPSYVLMAGMDRCIDLMQEQGEAMFTLFVHRLRKLRNALSGMKCLQLLSGKEADLDIYDYDESKIIISVENTELTGPELADILRGRYHLEVEMAAVHYVTAILSVCDTEEGFIRLEQALLQIDQELAWKEPEKLLTDVLPANEEVMSLTEADGEETEEVPLMQSCGRVSAEFAYLYPPGIPLIIPGECIPEDLPEKLRYYHSIGLNLQGLSDYSGKQIQVIKRNLK